MRNCQKQNRTKIVIEIVIFSFVTFSCGWLGVLADSLSGAQAAGGQLEGGSLGELIWLILPLLTATLIRIYSRDVKNAGLKLNFKKGWYWYVFAIGIYPVVCLILLAVGFVTNSIDFSLLKLEAPVGGFGVAVVQLLVLKIFEELPWRGFLAQKLLSLKLNDWLVYLINGFVWSSWHYAYYMVFLPDSYFQTGGAMAGLSRFSACIIATIVMTLWAILYVELYRLAKSVWPCLLVHVVEDLLFMYVFASWNGSIVTGRRLIMDTNFGILSVMILVGAGLILRSIRIKKEKM
jgi:membrane protease YdiL (CAAX protease family)